MFIYLFIYEIDCVGIKSVDETESILFFLDKNLMFKIRLVAFAKL